MIDIMTWDQDLIQFPRLLAELRAVGLTDAQYAGLCASMDLEKRDVDELLERSEAEWQRIKDNTDANGYHAHSMEAAGFQLLALARIVTDYDAEPDPEDDERDEDASVAATERDTEYFDRIMDVLRIEPPHQAVFNRWPNSAGQVG